MTPSSDLSTTLQEGKKNATHQNFSSQKNFMKVSYPQAYVLKLANTSPSCLLQVLFKLLLLCWVSSKVIESPGPLRVETWFSVALQLSFDFQSFWS